MGYPLFLGIPYFDYYSNIIFAFPVMYLVLYVPYLIITKIKLFPRFVLMKYDNIFMSERLAILKFLINRDKWRTIQMGVIRCYSSFIIDYLRWIVLISCISEFPILFSRTFGYSYFVFHTVHSLFFLFCLKV